MMIIENELGFEIKIENALIFFGKKEANIDNIKKKYSQFSFIKLKQTHSDIVLYSEINNKNEHQIDLHEGDAHFTKSNQVAICIATADCTPIFIYDQEKKIVAGIHAGWRGVANGITSTTIKKISSHGSNLNNLIAYIGPHIQRLSFEVEQPVRDIILKSINYDLKSNLENIFETFHDDKYLVDLSHILKKQMTDIGLNLSNIFELGLDTKTDQRFHSYRRDKENSGRQISFIVQLE